jgi:hypothetical protein
VPQDNDFSVLSERALEMRVAGLLAGFGADLFIFLWIHYYMSEEISAE